MDIKLRDKFLTLWKKYFNNAELPITFYFTDDDTRPKPAGNESLPRCVIGGLASVRAGKSLYFDAESLKCGKRFLGFSQEIRPNFNYFLSCGIPNKVSGERYVKTPEMVQEIFDNTPSLIAPGKYIVFKRWDKLDEKDTPQVVIFFAVPDVLSGLFTLARFDETDRGAIQAPFGSGCSAIVQNPYLEQFSEHPHAIIGMFDPSARISVPKDVLTLAVPMKKFVQMVDNMEESFLITDSWRKIQQRIT
ncbi:MAG: DUF169 domain-containing protein [Dehalococcoidales bacterium]